MKVLQSSKVRSYYFQNCRFLGPFLYSRSRSVFAFFLVPLPSRNYLKLLPRSFTHLIQHFPALFSLFPVLPARSPPMSHMLFDSVLRADLASTAAHHGFLPAQPVRLFIVVSEETVFVSTSTSGDAGTSGQTFLRSRLQNHDLP